MRISKKREIVLTKLPKIVLDHPVVLHRGKRVLCPGTRPQRKRHRQKKKKPKSQKKKSLPLEKRNRIKKKRGKRKGAKGYGRKVTLPITDEKEHRVQECAACGADLGESTSFVARTGLYVLDVKMANPGLEVSHVKHVYGDTTCNCGHVTQSKPARCPAEAN
ncbi:MAG TPA: hypothetical protein EYP90_07960 [Chromatiaceae bacterium]|nr:hypothetical protein [Chromatiaceae bacterium]